MNLEEAKVKILQMIDKGESRSHVCSFLNELATSKIISELQANNLADILASDKANAYPVMRSILAILISKE